MEEWIIKLSNYYSWYKSAHVISVIAWMAAMFYLPRLFVYHSQVEQGSEADITFKKMEYNLLKKIMNPAMISTYIFGFINAYIYGFEALDLWFHIKMFCVLLMTVIHAMQARYVKIFAQNKNTNSHKYYRIFNEVPVIIMIIIVIMVIVKPFE